MSFKFDATATQYLSGTLGATIAEPAALFAFVKHVDHPAVTQSLISMAAAAGSINSQMSIRYGTANERYSGTAVDNAAGTSTAVYDDTVQDNTWFGMVFVRPDENSQTLYVRAFANSVTTSVTRTTDPFGFMRVGRTMGGTNYLGAASPNETKAAEFGIVAGGVPTTQQITDYLAGVALSALGFGSNLKVYVSTATNSLANTGSDSLASLTNNNAAVYDSDHPIITTGGLHHPLSGKLGGKLKGKLG